MPGGVLSFAFGSDAAMIKNYAKLYACYDNQDDLVQDYVGSFEVYVDVMTGSFEQLCLEGQLFGVSYLVWETVHKMQFMVQGLRDFVDHKDDIPDCDLLALGLRRDLRAIADYFPMAAMMCNFDKRVHKVEYDVTSMFRIYGEVLKQEMEHVAPEQREAFTQEYKQAVSDLVLPHVQTILKMDRVFTKACKGHKIPSRNKMTPQEMAKGIQIDTDVLYEFWENNARELTLIHELDVVALAKLLPVVAKYSRSYENTRDSFFLIQDQLEGYTLEDIMKQVRISRLKKQANKANTASNTNTANKANKGGAQGQSAKSKKKYLDNVFR